MKKRQQKFLAAPKTDVIPKQRNDCGEKQKSCKEEKDRSRKVGQKNIALCFLPSFPQKLGAHSQL